MDNLHNYREYPYPYNLLLDITAGKNPNTASDFSPDSFSVALDEVLASLPKHVRVALQYRYNGQMTYREIGSMLGVSSATAGNRVRKGLVLLRHPARYKTLFGRSQPREIKQLSASKEPEDLTIIEAGLSSRASNRLMRAGMWTVGDVLANSPQDLAQIKGIGEAIYTEIIDRFRSLGIDVHEYRAFFDDQEHWKT